jgi:hypothetical protein
MAEITKKNTEKSTESKVVDAEKKEEVKEEEYIPTIEEGQYDPTGNDESKLTNPRGSSQYHGHWSSCQYYGT